MVAALALFEVGRQRAAFGSFLHGALNGPRVARRLLGLRNRAPRSSDGATDHDTGFYLRRDLHAFLRDGRRASLRFFGRVVTRREVASLLEEIEAVVEKWHEQHRTG